MPITRWADGRSPIADCRLPIADCRLPIADCRLPTECRPVGLTVKDVTMRVVAVLIGLVATSTTSITAQEPRLGSIDFPTSGSAEAQPHFIRGVLFLHSFEYGSAAEAFRKAQQTDPDFAMAYWGEAMTYNHPLWGQWDDDAAHATLERLAPTREARRAKAPTEREKLFLDAIEELWATGPKPQRDTAYSEAMERLVRAFPHDVEAKTFYALSVLGLSGTTRVFSSYMRAGAIANEVFTAHPHHPGAAHYVIHSFDDPIHAPLGLPAAEAYSEIAPDAAHAQHMTTHIFLAMGMWDRVVSQNTISADLTNWGPNHYTAWLEYGLLQQGRYDDARMHLERAHRNLRTPPTSGQRWYLGSMRAHYVINTERWDAPALEWTIDLADAGPVARAKDAFAHGYAALKRGDRDAVPAQLARLQTAAESGDEEDWGDRRAAKVLALNLAAAIAAEDGALARARELLDEATAVEDALPLEFGPPNIVKGSHELYGEILLAAGHAAEAQTQFERALQLTPGRARSLMGLAHAAKAAGDAKTAERAAAMLHEHWDSEE
jgi:tetratricopeptide (TPR) repeat protein